jgi:predicted DNA-binding transcriptional regulator YafY
MRKYYIEDLIQKCEEALAERYPDSDNGISRRALFDDLNDLDELVTEYGVEILRIRDGRRKFYRYNKENFSLFTKGFTEEELRCLKDNVQILQRFKGLPTFEWMTTLIDKLEDKISLKSCANSIISYEENADYSGIEWLKNCFDAIINQQPLKVEYRTFEDIVFCWVIHPYYIKQYNNRWFLIGYNPDYKRLSHVPLDRIDDLEPFHTEFITNTAYDFEKYFDDVVGVTVLDAEVLPIKLRFSKKRLQYVLTKPIHKSQRCVDPDSGIVTLRLIPNRELEALLLSFGPDVEVLEPLKLRNQIMEKIRIINEHYCTSAN